jgi:hypothetical protein
MSKKIESEIKAFEAMKEELLTHHDGKFVVIKDGQLVGAYDTFSNAAKSAVKAFGRGPYLIRQVGSPTLAIPASVAYRVLNAAY